MDQIETVLVNVNQAKQMLPGVFLENGIITSIADLIGML